ncbi:DUF6311 domain-containing protein [Polynucleobacter sp. IMCC 30228]|uniref:DUF6311 domain-containing protein n=1 Tax=Polynucleobacter sp. IMCC 30228 TaxID=2781011 RepID=UPI001F47EA46|nr:DUF6311 domain-containing protein [Polynucleobacter sp. IMCC 30228]MCE7527798.1 DUF6311 domain-containing protein [Polynucleobacter sp. IMCC 30228]
MVKREVNLYLFLLPLLIGAAAFFLIAGPHFLNPLNIAWLSGGDSLQHYLGWAFFRNSPWDWPLGLNPKYGMDFSNSIVFTDSIPLLAIPFKVISRFLSEPFQYFGLWVLGCFVLQAWFAYKLVALVSANSLVCALATFFFVFSPPLIFRMGLHESLMGHFLILAGLYLNLRAQDKNQAVWWILLLSVSALTHFYFLVMLLVLWIADLLGRTLVKKTASPKFILIEIGITIFILLFTLWQAGFFAVSGASGATRGFGDFRTNLLALFNSRGWSYWLKPINLHDSVEAATGEGFQYLGAGNLFLLLCAICALIKRKLSLQVVWQKYLFLLLALLAMALISFSNHIGIGSWNFRLDLPTPFLSVLSFVRSSARLFWPFYYASIFLILYWIIKGYSKKTTYLILVIGALFQIIDTSAGWRPMRKIMNVPISSEFKSPLKNPFWKAAGLHYQNVVMNERPIFWETFGLYAAQYGLSTNMVHLARLDDGKANKSMEKLRKEVNQGPLNVNSLYIFRDWKDSPQQIRFDPKVDLLARIDGFNVLAPGWKVCANCPPRASEKALVEKLTASEASELNQLAPEISLGEKIIFSSQGRGRVDFMLEGWGYGENWGTWAIAPQAKLIFNFPSSKPKKMVINTKAFLAPKHLQQEIEVWGNGSLLGKAILKKSDANQIEVTLPDQVMANPILNLEFRSINAVSPKDMGLSADERLLGIGLQSIQFTR